MLEIDFFNFSISEKLQLSMLYLPTKGFRMTQHFPNVFGDAKKLSQFILYLKFWTCQEYEKVELRSPLVRTAYSDYTGSSKDSCQWK